MIARWLRREFVLVVSEHILAEAAEAWEQPYWARRYSTAHVAEAITLLRERAIVVTPVTTVHGVGEDEEDDLVIATAVGGGVQHLVTGDKALQALVRYGEIEIVSPRQFLDQLDQERAGKP